MFYHLSMEGILSTKWCGDCRRLQSVVDFNYKYRDRGVLQHVCKPCQSIRAHEHYLRNAAAYQKRVARNNKRIREANRRRLLDYLLVQKCYDCGLQDLAALEFDHRDPRQKRKDVSTLAG